MPRTKQLIELGHCIKGDGSSVPRTEGVQKERIGTMRVPLIDTVSCDEKMLNDELPDAALEFAASKCSEPAGNPYTIAFCSGLDTCPALAR